MKETVHIYPTLEHMQQAALNLCKKATEQGKRPLIIVETTTQIENVRRKLAAWGAGFGVEVNTLPFWVSDIWPLYGTSATPISHAERIALSSRILQEQDVLPKTPGMVHMLARTARQALIYRGKPAKLVGNETAFVALLEAYAQQLQQRQTCEYCEMLEMLSQQPLKETYIPIVFDTPISSYSTAEQGFLESAGALFLSAELCVTPQQERTEELGALLEALFKRSEHAGAVKAQGALVCALSAGPTAQNHLVYTCLTEAIHSVGEQENARIVVAAKNPAELFDYCAPMLYEQSINVQLSASKGFAQTDAGRALFACLSLGQTPEDYSKLEAADFALNPFTHIWFGNAFKLDCVHRGNRLIQAQTIRTNIEEQSSEHMQQALELFSQGIYSEAIDQLEHYAETTFAHSAQYKAEQLKALNMARETLEAARQTGAKPRLVLESLAKQPISTRASFPTIAHAPTVIFTTLINAAHVPPASVEALVVCDLTVDAYPVRVQEEALSTLLNKWGIHIEKSPLEQLRRRLFHALAAARKRVYLQRTLNDHEASPRQAAVLFEEVMDCYRTTLSSFSDIDETLGIPQALVPYALQAGEDQLMANASNTKTIQWRKVSWPPAGYIEEKTRQLLVLPRLKHATHKPAADLSASQIESYLECPYQWFAKRRLRIEEIEEGFGALERGTFVHNVLRAFYESFQQNIAPKVLPENLEQAQQLFDTVFQQQLEHDYEREPGRRYIPLTAWEKQLIVELHQQLRASLENEAKLLRQFRPLHLEWEFGIDQPILYAGCNLTGAIDRIDIDKNNNAVVIDYKTGKLADYNLLAHKDQEEFTLPYKVQTLIYAKIVQSVLGLNVVGALYYNPLTGDVRGAYSEHHIGPADLLNFPSSAAEYNKIPTFEFMYFTELLDACEQLIEQQLSCLSAGNINPAPLHSAVCRYCPVGICEHRAQQGA